MTLQTFRQIVRAEFGGDLRRMTPANVREFLDRIQPEVEGAPKGGRYYLNEPEHTYEAILRDFLRQSLEIAPEQAVIRLWLHCLEMSIADLSDVEAEKFHRLFAQAGFVDGD